MEHCLRRNHEAHILYHCWEHIATVKTLLRIHQQGFFVSLYIEDPANTGPYIQSRVVSLD
jgi:hypothetical protein